MNSRPQLLEYHLAPGVRAFSTLRGGGCSEGVYASFNVNAFCGDRPEHVAANREALCRELGIGVDRLILPRQTHGCRVLAVDEALLALTEGRRAERLEGVDAVMTDVPGVCVGVSTADCIPVVLCDETRRAVAAVHAGWRGTVGRIVEKAVAAMAARYGSRPEELKAVIGPGISQAAFEVGEEVYDAFAAAGFPMDAIARRTDKWHIDLPAANYLQLEAAGLPMAAIQVSGHCTYTESDTFFSARRLGISSGRIYTGILLSPSPK